MKRLTALLAAGIISTGVYAQDTTDIKKPDTMRIGNIHIIKKGKNVTDSDNADEKRTKGTTIVMGRNNEYRKSSRITTNWWIVDLGFANYTDKTDYATAGSYLVNNPNPLVPGISGSDFKLKAG